MADNGNLILQIITLIAAVLLLIGSITWFAPAVIDCPKCPACPEIETPVIDLNLTSLEEGIAGVQSTLDEDDDWENEAKALAIEELEDDDYEELYDYMTDTIDEDGLGLEIDDEDDIDKVLIKDVAYTAMDADDKDGTVTLKLRVYYENSEGDDKKETIYAEVTIEEGEVEELEFGDEFKFK